MNKKAQIWISVVIYTLVAVLALVLILNTAIPILTEMRDKAIFTKIRDIMLEMDNQISEIANQGEGTQKKVAFQIRDGTMKFEDNELAWEYETKSEIISPRTSSILGNMIISSNANVRTYETDDYYVMTTSIKDDLFTVVFNKIGTSTNWASYNTEQIIKNITHNNNTMTGVFHFNLNDDPSSAQGVGYTEMIPSGDNSNLGSAKVVAHMNSSFGSYDLEFTLESYADFITTKVTNFKS
jgi:hypothetical protein